MEAVKETKFGTR